MAHIARIKDGIVEHVHVVENRNCLDASGQETEEVAIAFLKLVHGNKFNDCVFKQTSRSARIRKNYAGIGYGYNENLDAFIPPKPGEGWVLNENTCNWEQSI